MATKRGLPTTREELVLMLINRKQPRAVDLDGECTYSHSSNGGCAIGVAVTKGVAEFLQLGSDQLISIKEGLLGVPKRLLSMGVGFLEDLQAIHDEDECWWESEKATIGSNGLIWNEDGVKQINHLIRTYDLKLEKIESLELV